MEHRTLTRPGVSMQAKNLEEAPFRSRSQIFLSTKKLEKNELQLPLVGACPGVSRDGCLVSIVAYHTNRGWDDKGYYIHGIVWIMQLAAGWLAFGVLRKLTDSASKQAVDLEAHAVAFSKRCYSMDAPINGWPSTYPDAAQYIQCSVSVKSRVWRACVCGKRHSSPMASDELSYSVISPFVPDISQTELSVQQQPDVLSL
ncbi:hypothetical protein IWW34DRAFT_826310 [Fusarium oxysporum f. sp. albedinis]|nr:hypothetical protein IWW34DRAFT_826310 [Fusarium oxysporum f. sp. albedinis]